MPSTNSREMAEQTEADIRDADSGIGSIGYADADELATLAHEFVKNGGLKRREAQAFAYTLTNREGSQTTGDMNYALADLLGLSESTYRTHRSNSKESVSSAHALHYMTDEQRPKKLLGVGEVTARFPEADHDRTGYTQIVIAEYTNHEDGNLPRYCLKFRHYSGDNPYISGYMHDGTDVYREETPENVLGRIEEVMEEIGSNTNKKIVYPEAKILLGTHDERTPEDMAESGGRIFQPPNNLSKLTV